MTPSSKRIAFLCEVNLPNYVDDKNRYNYLKGRHSATGYYYWILRNYGYKNIDMVLPGTNLNDYDIVVFHYDDRNSIKVGGKYKTIQVVTDRPQVVGVDLYICCNLSIISTITNKDLIRYVGIGLKHCTYGKWEYIPYPMAINYTPCNASWPPKIFHYTGRKGTLIDDIYSEKFIFHMKEIGVNLRFDFDNDHNSGDEDVYFCVRKKTNYYSSTCMGNNVDTKLGHKTANRLYQAWKMGTPLITSAHSAMCAIYKTEYDFMIAENLDEFEYQSLRLVNDKVLFENMVNNCKSRRDEHSNYVIVKKFTDIFKIL